MLSLQHLRTFLAAIRYRSFTRAAIELQITQPAVSAHIAALEAELKAPLFNRTGRRIILTDAGRIAERHARAVLGELDAMKQEIDDLQGLHGGTIAIGASRIIGVYMMPRILMAFRDRFPDIEMTISIHSAHTIRQQVEDNCFDLAIVGEGDPIDSSAIGVKPIGEDRLVIVAPPSHRLAGRTRVTAAELKSEVFILSGRLTASLQSLKSQLARIGFTFRSSLSMDDAGAIKRAVAEGAGLAILSSAVVEAEVREGRLIAFELADHPLRRKILMLWRQDRRFSKNTEAFMRFLQEAFADTFEKPSLPQKGEKAPGPLLHKNS